MSAAISDVEKYLKKLELKYGSDIRKLVTVNIPEKSDDRVMPEKVTREEEIPEEASKVRGIRKPSGVSYTAMIDGKEKTYKYRSAYLRNKFLSVQRDNYKNQCNEHKVQYILKMYNELAGFYWREVGRKIDDEEILTSPIDLFLYYHELKDEEKAALFIGNKHYIDIMRKVYPPVDEQ